jgi:hypothetical protein
MRCSRVSGVVVAADMVVIQSGREGFPSQHQPTQNHRDSPPKYETHTLSNPDNQKTGCVLFEFHIKFSLRP